MVEPTIQLDTLDAVKPSGRSHGGCAGCGTGSALAATTRCGNGLEKIYPTTAVRFGFMRYIGEFTHAPDLRFTCGAKVVIQTQRGIEIGEQVSLTCGGCDKSVPRDQMKAWVEACGEETYMFNAGRILREATAADLAEFARIQESSREKRDFARRVAIRHDLPLKVVECECLFGGERIIFFFISPERVDFRAMVRDLAREYRTRIEMRQIGARDEARLLADFETCGREVCCKVFLKTLRPISMRMAKLQKATLDPTQVSGRCGRLKCCLRYEHIGYEELDRRLPRTGERIRTQHGDGVVVNRQILTQLVQIQADNGSLMTVVAEDIISDKQRRGGAAGDARESPSATEARTPPAEGRALRKKGPKAERRPGRRPSTPSEHSSAEAPREEETTKPPADAPRGSEAEGEQTRRKRRRRRRRTQGGQAGRRGHGPGPGATGSDPSP